MVKFFQNMPEIAAVMSEREDGSMKLFEDSELNLENRKRFFEKIGIGENKVVAAEIVHETDVAIVDNASPEIMREADGLVAKDENVFLSVTVADCIPVYFYEPEQKIIAIAHCGWRGIVDGIIESSVNKVIGLGGKAENLKVALGPGIDKCHFEIREDVLERFSKYPEFIIRREDKIFVDLKGIIRKQLANFNINTENIEDNKECTVEHDRYFSYRRDRPKSTEAMIAIIGFKIED
ncbi:MAG: hypothetical protein ACD_15C00151G0003 [uncultured bacterium]|nr:MAG: hypothetical protein ACD_15C00151G0003 [uncultured bacterium]